MKRIITTLCVALFSATLFSSCILEKRHSSTGELRGDLARVAFPITDFSTLRVSGSSLIYFTQGPADSVVIEADSKILDDEISVEQDGAKLIIKSQSERSNFNSTSPKVVIYVSTPNIERFDVSGANSIKMQDSVKVQNLAINISGAGDVKARYLAVSNECSLEISGAGEADFKNVVCDVFDVRMSGAGNLDAKVTKASNVKIRVSGAGDADLDLDDCGDIRCDVSGAADIDLEGTARNLTYSGGVSSDVSYSDLKLSGSVEKL